MQNPPYERPPTVIPSLKGAISVNEFDPHWAKRENTPSKQPDYDPAILGRAIDTFGSSLSDREKRLLLAGSADGAIRELLQCGFGDEEKPEIERLYRIFGDLVKQEIRLPRLIMVVRFCTLAECLRCMEDNRAILADDSIQGMERVSAHKATLEVVARMNQIVTEIQRYSIKFEADEKKRMKPEKRAVTGVAPALD